MSNIDTNIPLTEAKLNQSSNTNNNSCPKRELSSEIEIGSTSENSSSNNQSDYLSMKRGRSDSPSKENKVLQKTSSKSFTKNKYINDFFKPTSIHNSNSSINCNSTLQIANDLKEKEKEIAFLKAELETLQEKFEQSEKEKKEKNENANKVLISLLKELEDLKRKNKKRDLHEDQLKIGKYSLIRTARGQYIDLWEDGEEMTSLKAKLNDIRERITHLINTKQENTFQFYSLQREEKVLKAQYDNIEFTKIKYLLDTRTFSEETNCYYSKSWPLLNNRYQLLSLLGKGGYSEVYKAFDLVDKKYVACKVYLIKQNWPKEICENYIKHTLREIEIHKTINCSKIIKQLDVFDIDGNSYCTVLEFCNGGDLGTYLKLYRTLTEKEVQDITKQILIGLDYLNQRKKKIIHYDIKPQNILFHNKEIKISDFGISKIIDNESSANASNIELTSQGIGTYYYLPPECFEIGKNVTINSKVDIWSVGVMCFEMIYGKKPFGHGCSQDKLFDIMSEYRKVVFPLVPQVSQECKEFIMKCLEWKIDARFEVSQAMTSKFITKEYKESI